MSQSRRKKPDEPTGEKTAVKSMKKTFLFIVLVSIVRFAYGQETNTIKGYQKGLEFNYSALVDYSGGDHVSDYDNTNISYSHYNLDMKYTVIDYAHSFNLNFVNGYRFNSYLFMGGGVGLNATVFGVKKVVLIGNWDGSYELDEFSMQIPIFVRVHANFSPKKVSPFASFDVGGNIGIYNDYERVKESFFGHSLFIKPAIGINIDFKEKQSLYIAFIYEMNYAPKNESYSSHINHSIGGRIGFNF